MERVKRRRAGIAALICIFLVIAGGAIYLDQYYHAGDEAAREMVRSSGVEVREANGAILFDGPGTEAALVFYPGGKVEAEAYAPLLRAVAEQGVDAFLLKVTARLAILDIDAASRVMRDHRYAHWTLAGHSLGGYAAAAYAARHPEVAEGLILLAAYAAKSIPKSMRLLTILGDHDGILNMKNYERYRVNWPRDTREVVLPGGNHAGFGDYGPQKGDGESSMPAGSQCERTAELMTAFCTESAETMDRAAS